MPDYEVKKQPAGFGREKYVVYRKDGVPIGSADTEVQAEIVGMTNELKGN